MNTGNKQLLGAFENVDVVCYDYYGAYRQLAAAWWQAGRRRFGYVVPAASNKGKVAVFRAAVESVGGSLPDENIICVPSANYINIPTVVRQALAQDDRATKLDGVACSCDSIGPKIMEIGVILAIFRSFEDFQFLAVHYLFHTLTIENCH